MTDLEIKNLMINLGKITPNRWYKLTGREDAENLISVIKMLIDCHIFFGSAEYVISNDYSSFMKKVELNIHEIPWHKRALDPEYKIKTTKEKTNWVWERQFETKHEIYFNDQLIATELC